MYLDNNNVPYLSIYSLDLYELEYCNSQLALIESGGIGAMHLTLVRAKDTVHSPTL